MRSLESEYASRRRDVLVPLAEKLEDHLSELLRAEDRIDKISARAKAVERFVEKAEKIEDGVRKYANPLSEIQDQVGARVVTFYTTDVDRIANTIKKYLRPIEEKSISPESESEFGYVGKHYILFLPSEILDETIDRERAPAVFELQVKTLFQHAWSEANHDLGYKPTGSLASNARRKLAFTAAQAWGADSIFAELHIQSLSEQGE